MKIFQKGFNYSQDGDGNRLVYHMQGCNLKCPWCANPEGMQCKGTIVSDPEWILESICPHGAISGTKVDRTICVGCKNHECITEHDTKGMYLSYQNYTVDEIVEEVLNNEMMFYDGGGVTFTGGEVTMQFEELLESLKKLKEHRINTAIETNGTHIRTEELFPYVDQLIMDCKLCDPVKHQKYTGGANEEIMKNIRKAAKEHPYFHVRVPLIGGVNNATEDLEAFVRFFKEINGQCNI